MLNILKNHNYIPKIRPLIRILLAAVVSVLFTGLMFWRGGKSDMVFAPGILFLIYLLYEGVPLIFYIKLQAKEKARGDKDSMLIFREDAYAIQKQDELPDQESTKSYDLIAKVVETGSYFVLYINDTSDHVMKSTTNVIAIDKSKIEGGSAKDLHDTLQANLGERLTV